MAAKKVKYGGIERNGAGKKKESIQESQGVRREVLGELQMVTWWCGSQNSRVQQNWEEQSGARRKNWYRRVGEWEERCSENCKWWCGDVAVEKVEYSRIERNRAEQKGRIKTGELRSEKGGAQDSKEGWELDMVEEKRQSQWLGQTLVFVLMVDMPMEGLLLQHEIHYDTIYRILMILV